MLINNQANLFQAQTGFYNLKTNNKNILNKANFYAQAQDQVTFSHNQPGSPSFGSSRATISAVLFTLGLLAAAFSPVISMAGRVNHISDMSIETSAIINNAEVVAQNGTQVALQALEVIKTKHPEEYSKVFHQLIEAESKQEVITALQDFEKLLGPESELKSNMSEFDEHIDHYLTRKENINSDYNQRLKITTDLFLSGCLVACMGYRLNTELFTIELKEGVVIDYKPEYNLTDILPKFIRKCSNPLPPQAVT